MNVIKTGHAYGKNVLPDQDAGSNYTAIRSLEPSNVIMYLVTTLLLIGIIMIYSTSSAKVTNSAHTFNSA